MVRRTKTSADIKAEIALLQVQLDRARKKEGERVGALAIKAGLHELDIPEDDLLTALKELAARFRDKPGAKDQTA